MYSPLSNLDSLRIGSVEFVSPDEIKAMLDIEAPNDVALNTGLPRPFPRINSYVLIPNENGFLVAQIVWITIERSQYPKRKGIQDFGILDLPYPLRKMSLNPLGILRTVIEPGTSKMKFIFSRGIEDFPTVGDPVLVPTEQQLKSIVESGENQRVNIGTCPVADDATVSVDPNRLFSRHLAVLGNTGSGKSCSVAGIIRWSIEAAQKETNNNSNTHFIILDPNGEYAAAFQDMPGFRVYGAEKDDRNRTQQLKVPIWLWNSSEWAAFTQASSRAQRPTLIQALRSVRTGQTDVPDLKIKGRRDFLKTLLSIINMDKKKGSPWGKFAGQKEFYLQLNTWNESLDTDDAYTPQQNEALSELRDQINELLSTPARSQSDYPDYIFSESEVNNVFYLTEKAFEAFGGSPRDDFVVDEDTPVPFTGESLLRCLEATAELMNTSEYIETMLIRIKSLLDDPKLKPVISDDEDNPMNLEQWLNEYICPSDSSNGSITVFDLSLIPEELTHLITSVIARMTLEALQRYRRVNNGATLPTVLVMEEAHTFIKKYTGSEGETENLSRICTKIFERIAREGRKFGLGLILSSQRPSELSSTVLSQCNSYLLHRISKDKDQELVNNLVTDNLKGMLRELPSLPSRNAILLGWASEIPVLVRMNYLKKEYRPRSEDPDFWNAWTEEQEKRRDINWKEVVQNWNGIEE